jgi:hypothetical protein
MRARVYARACGLLYLYIIVAALFAEAYVRGRLVVATDAAVTAANIRGHETLFRVGFTADLLNVTCDIAVVVILYVLLKPVNRNLALVGAFVRLAADAVLGVALLAEFTGLRVLVDGGDFLKGFDPQQTEALAMLMFKLHGYGYTIAMVFFGLGLVVSGYLIVRSGYFPRALGAVLIVAGAGYLIDCFSRFLAPLVAAVLFPWLLLPGFLAELALCGWLLFKGVDMPKWEAAVGGHVHVRSAS